MPPSVSCCWFQSAFLLAHEQWVHTRVRYKISAGSVFLNLKNASIEISPIEIFSISSYTKKLQWKIHRSFRNAIWYRLKVIEATNGFTFQIINSWIESWLGSTVIPPSETCQSVWVIFAFTALFSLWNMMLQPNFFHCFRYRTKSTSL